MPAVLSLGLLGLWDFLLRTGAVNQVLLPAPEPVARALYEYIVTGGSGVLGSGDVRGFYFHFWSTVSAAIGGWLLGALIGFLLAVIVVEWPKSEAVLEPYVVAINGLPKVAIAPIIALWFGFDPPGKIALVVLLTAFPVWASTVTGLRALPASHADLLGSLGANRRELFLKVRLPNALPHIFVGFHLAAIYGLIGAVVAEFVGADRGLGTVMLREIGKFRMANVFAILVVFSVLGIVIHGFLGLLRRRVVFWRSTEEQVVTL